MKKRHGLPVPERTEAAPDQRVKWLRAIRIGLCLALGCSLTLMLISLLLIFRANWQAWTQPQTERAIKRRRICDPDQEKFDQ